MTTNEMGTYIIHDYSTGDVIGELLMTERAYHEAMSLAKMPKGVLSIDDLAECLHNGLPAEFDSVPCDTTVWIEE